MTRRFLVSGGRPRRIALALAVAVAVAAGCESPDHVPVVAGPGYWTSQRLIKALPWRAGHFHLPPEPTLSPGTTPSPRDNAYAPRVGALFDTDISGNHFCTASVVDSPAGNVLITAAHCVNDGTGGPNTKDIVFIPDYSDGQTPHGVWTPERYVMDPRWVNGADQDFDVAFIVLKPLGGSNIEDVLGANKIAFDDGYQHLVRVTGYPSSASAPISCSNWTSEQSQTQLKFACQDFTGGTSGSPWVTGFDPVTRSGTIVGVIGGYREGGDTPEVSYSTYLNDDIKKLYDQAISG